jgi:ankyrin repeat protein
MTFNKRSLCCLVLLLVFPVFSLSDFSQGREQAGPDRQKIAAELFAAAEKGDLETVKNLLTKYPDMKNVKQNGGWTLLHVALNSREMVEYLIKIGANIEAKSDGQWTPLHSQVYYGHQDGVELLLEHGADIEAKFAYDITPLLSSIRFNRVAEAAVLVGKGAKVDSPDAMGRTALILSATKGYSELAKVLLDGGADVRIRDKNEKRTALHFAALNGHLSIVAELLKKGADVNAKDAAGKTPLDYANTYGHEKVAKLLKSSGAEGEFDPRNFGFSPELKEILKEGEAYAWYMGRAGYAVKTKNHFLLFSYFVEGNLPEEPRLANGHVDLDEIADCDTIVFAGGSQYWHHNPERYSQWQKAHQSISFIYSFEDKPGRNAHYLKDVEGPAYIYLPGGEKTTIKGVKVQTVPVLGLGRRGSGFLVEADGVAIFFGGDHVLLSESQRDAYRKTIDDLKNTGKAIDLLILPATIAMDRAAPISVDGVDYAIKTLKPKAYLASDGESTEFVLSGVTAALAKYKNQTKIFCPEHRGDMFILKD